MSYQTYNTKNFSYDFRSTYPCVEVDENQSPKVYTQLNTVNSVVFGSLSNANTSRIFGTDKTNFYSINPQFPYENLLENPINNQDFLGFNLTIGDPNLNQSINQSQESILSFDFEPYKSFANQQPLSFSEDHTNPLDAISFSGAFEENGSFSTLGDSQSYEVVKIKEENELSSSPKLEINEMDETREIKIEDSPKPNSFERFEIKKTIPKFGKDKKIFPFRLWELASNESFEPIKWNYDGTMIMVNLQSINNHLLDICRTKKYASFLRQLHLYGFRKDSRCLPNKRSVTKYSYYSHRFFRRNDYGLLNKINRVKN
ncbi:heat shock factor [Blomia tropicalis]|nr:heat shock factor [Blomia tropicalis]